MCICVQLKMVSVLLIPRTIYIKYMCTVCGLEMNETTLIVW